MMLVAVGGTTSACAENTYTEQIVPIILRNYLRVRGEYCDLQQDRQHRLELPPRARRIRLRYWGDDRDEGTTSACAENTWGTSATPAARGNYLRVRGEYTSAALGTPAE